MPRANKPGRPRRTENADAKLWKMRDDGYSYTEIATEAKLPVGTVYSRLNPRWKRHEQVKSIL